MDGSELVQRVGNLKRMTHPLEQPDDQRVVAAAADVPDVVVAVQPTPTSPALPATPGPGTVHQGTGDGVRRKRHGGIW